MISVQNLSKNHGEKTLLNNVSFTINKGEKAGLIGPNGSGKSTFFLMVMGRESPTSGSIHTQKNIQIGYLPQESSFASDHTVLTELVESNPRIISLKQEKDSLEERNEAGLARYGEVLHELERMGYFTLEYKAKKILMGLGFKEKDFHRPIKDLSGGWQMRALLGKLLTFPYDILLLDEPTNYLDLNAALWLKEYLAGCPGTVVMISHDKAFLTEVTNYTLVLENGSITKVSGNYSHYEEIKTERYRFLLRQFKEQEKKRQQLEEFVRRFHAQPNKASAVRSKRTILERMEEEPIVLPPDPSRSIRDFSFPSVRQSGYVVIRLKGVDKSYGENSVYKGLNFELVQGKKAVLVGENGAGKSTLLKMLAGVTEIDAGERSLGYNVDPGYFSQTRMDVLNPDNSVLEEAYTAAPRGFMPQEQIRTILGAFLFHGGDVEKKVKVLSGGEKSRLILSKLIINPPNFMLLDEPTTHLDVDAVDALVSALSQYQGTLVCISHDIYFVRAVATTVLEVNQGRITEYYGNFDYYLEKKKQQQGSVAGGSGMTAEGPLRLKSGKQAREGADDDPLAHKHQKDKLKKKLIKGTVESLERKEGKLRMERYAKTRALANTHIYRDEETLNGYKERIKQISSELVQIREQVKKLKGLMN